MGLEQYSKKNEANQEEKEGESEQVIKRNNWQHTKNDNVMVKLKIAKEDQIIPYRLFIKKVDSEKFKGYMMQLARLVYDEKTNQFSCDFDSAKPTWFTPQEYIDFVQALGEL